MYKDIRLMLELIQILNTLIQASLAPSDPFNNISLPEVQIVSEDVFGRLNSSALIMITSNLSGQWGFFLLGFFNPFRH
jgi:hypothetical protein